MADQDKLTLKIELNGFQGKFFQISSWLKVDSF